MKRAGVVAVAVLVLASACSTPAEQSDETRPTATSAAPQAPSTAAASPTQSRREEAEEAFIEWLRGPASDAGVDVSELTDAQAIAQGDRMCQRIADVEAGGGEASVRGIALLVFLEDDALSEDGSNDESAMNRLVGVTFGAIDHLCPEHSGIPTEHSPE